MLPKKHILSSREQAVRFAQKIIDQKPVFLDTETTGLDSKAEIIEIGIVDHDGTALFQSLVKPIQTTPANTSHIHGITLEMLKDAKPWPLIWNEIRGLLFGRLIGMYNVNFDMKMIEQTNKIYHIPRPNFQTFDIMKIYAQYKGIWNKQYRSYQLFKQEVAARQCGIAVNNLHRAVNDALLARGIFYYIADSAITPSLNHH